MRKFLFLLVLFLPDWCLAQTQVTVIPGSLRVVKVAHNSALNDSVAVLDVNNNLKKAVMPGGGGSATGVNGLNGTTNIGLGGTLTGNTVINNNGSTLAINQNTGGPFIQQWQFNSTNVAGMDATGNLNLNGIRYLTNGNTGRIDFTGGTTTAIRNAADNQPGFQVALLNTGATGNIAQFQNYAYSTFSIGQGVTQSPFTKTGYNMMGGLKPTTNGDTLIGMYIHPMFGVSTVNGVGTLVGGSGYPNGTRYSNITGGTGVQCVLQVTVSAGAVTSVSMISGGVNYTVGDVLHIVITDANGNPIGSGGSVTVTSLTSYSGIVKWAMLTAGLDQYDMDRSATYTVRSKTDKGYVDSRTVSGSFSATGSSTTTFTVTLGTTQPTNTYKVQVTPTSAIAAGSGFYVANKSTTQFQVIYPAGLTGAVSMDWLITQ